MFSRLAGIAASLAARFGLCGLIPIVYIDVVLLRSSGDINSPNQH